MKANVTSVHCSNIQVDVININSTIQRADTAHQNDLGVSFITIVVVFENGTRSRSKSAVIPTLEQR